MTHPLHSSERTDWQTPPEVLDRTRRIGPIVLDPCTSPSNPTGASLFYSPGPCLPGTAFAPGWLGSDGLRATLPTVGLSFWNPPYGRHLSGEIDPEAPVTRKGVIVGYGTGWAAKWAAHEGEKIALVPNRTETDWWARMYQASDWICLPDHRIAFVDPDTGEIGSQPNHGSTIFYADRGYPAMVDPFGAAFEDFGIIIPGGRRL